MSWLPLISAGVSIAQGLLDDDTADKAANQSRENLILTLQDKERARAQAGEQHTSALQNSLAIANANNAAQMEATKKRVLGDVLLRQGEGQNQLMNTSLAAGANKPERFNAAATNLASILSR